MMLATAFVVGTAVVEDVEDIVVVVGKKEGRAAVRLNDLVNARRRDMK